jgi:hypothetical protein
MDVKLVELDIAWGPSLAETSVKQEANTTYEATLRIVLLY